MSLWLMGYGATLGSLLVLNYELVPTESSSLIVFRCIVALLTPPVHCPDMSEPPPARDITAPPLASSMEIHAKPLVALPVSAPAQVPTELTQSPDVHDVYEEQPTVHSAPPTPVAATSAPPSEDTAPRHSRRDRHMPAA